MAPLLLGAVAYDPKVVTIWEGFRAWLRTEGFDLDFVLYSNYERQVEDLLDDRIDVAWNSPLAWVRSHRLAGASGRRVDAVLMRDTDRDLRSVVVVRAGSGIESVAALRGRTVATGALDSPQATLLPLSMVRAGGLQVGVDVTVRRFDVGPGLHGDHIGGERDAARSLAAGEVDAACMTDANRLLFVQEGVLGPGQTEVLATTGLYDHCNMTTSPSSPSEAIQQFCRCLLSMSFEDDRVRPLLELEGLHQWLPGRLDGYAALEQAVDEAMFYDHAGRITADAYRP
jgi:ABC-type phosphate/phosphonate transport system substrate-binding protein